MPTEETASQPDGLTTDQLVSEVQEIEKRIHSYIEHSTTAFQLGIVILGTAASIGFAGTPETFIPVPVLLTLLLIIATGKERETKALAEWQKRLERRIYQRTGEYLTIWETSVSDRSQGGAGKVSRWMFAFYVFLSLAMWTTGFLIAVDLATWILALYVPVFVLLNIALWVGYSESDDLAARVKQHSEEKFSCENPAASSADC